MNDKAVELKYDEMLKVWRRIKTSLLYMDLLNVERCELLDITLEDSKNYFNGLGNTEIPEFIDYMDKRPGLKRLC